MFRRFTGRAAHYALLAAVAACLYLPALGAPSLWDIDEGHNAECAREMLESGNWTVPTFNYQLRVDKPALLYWLQIAAYQLWGVGELAARLPSALAALLTVLLTYELGRRMFDATAGLLAGLVLASTGLFAFSAHFANPDALLNACTVLTFYLFWRSFERVDGHWPVLLGASTGLGFLAKGPVALVLPTAVVGLYLLWTRQVRKAFGIHFFAAGMVFCLVALPWFALVGVDTKGEFLSGFFLKHNRDRFLASMEGHDGPIFYHVISLVLGFLPWSAFLGSALWYAVQEWRAGHPSLTLRASKLVDERTRRALQFLACWFAVYFVFFSISATKLPSYILPLYPAVALIVGRFLSRWLAGTLAPKPWVSLCSLAAWMLFGLGAIVGILAAGGALGTWVRHPLSGLERFAWIGNVLLLGAGLAYFFLRRQDRLRALTTFGATAVAFVALLGALGTQAVDAHKAPRELAELAQARRGDRDIAVGCYGWYQPSLVFYCQREVQRCSAEKEAVQLLESPLPVYLFVPAAAWNDLAGKVSVPCRLLGARYDLYRNLDVVVVTNQ